MKIKGIILALIVLSQILKGYGQENTDSNLINVNDTIEEKDSVFIDSSKSNNKEVDILGLINKLKIHNDSLRRMDSLERIALLNQVNELKLTNKQIQENFRQKELHLGLKDSVERVKTVELLDSLRQNTIGYAVAPFNDTLFYIYLKNGAVTAMERAISANQKIARVEQLIDIENDTIAIVDNIQTIDIVFKDEILISVTDNDALFLNSTKYEVADTLHQLISKSVKDYYIATNLKNIIRQVGLALLVIIIQLILIFFINWVFKKINQRITLLKGNKLKGIRIKSYKVLDAKSQLNLVLFFSKIIRYFIIAIMLFISIPIIFSIFPLTKNIAYKLFDYILSPVNLFYTSIVSYFPNLVTIIVIYVITKYAVKGIGFLANEIELGKFKIQGFYPDWAKPTFNPSCSKKLKNKEKTVKNQLFSMYN